MKIALFPLPLFLLPGGVTKLRIFEPRYIRLVKESLKNDSGFILAMQEKNTICKLGTLVKIIDFETLSDGLLGIDIQGCHRVKISDISQEKDRLWVGNAEILPDWQPLIESAGELGYQLDAVFQSHPNHAAQYQKNTNFNDTLWVCQRWLEILPLSNAQRQWFLAQTDARFAIDFISDVLTPSFHEVN